MNNNSDIVLVKTSDLQQMIRDSVFEAVSECLPAAIPDTNQFYTISEVAEKWGVTAQTIWRYTKMGKLKVKRVGRFIRFDKAYIDGLDSLGGSNESGRTYWTKAEKALKKKKKKVWDKLQILL